jgi:uncharacterized protein (DUF1330 family)
MARTPDAGLGINEVTRCMLCLASYLVYICQAVKDRAGLERYWQIAPAVYPENIDVLVGYGPFEVLDADQDERVEGVVIAEFPPFEQTVEWFNGDAYVQARKDRTNGNEYLSMVVDSGVAPISKRSVDKPAMYSSFAVKLWTRGSSIPIGGA